MKPFRNIWSWLRSLWQRRELKREIDEELGFHLEQRTAENLAAGMPPEEAERAARKKFGNAQNVREQCRDLRGVSFGETLWQDIRFGGRMLRKNPGFTAIAVLTLAFGIGANTAIFSVVNAVLLRPLPFRDPDRLVMVWNTMPEEGDYRQSISYPDFQDWKNQSQTLEDMALAQPCGGAFADAAGAVNLEGGSVSSSFFSLLGVKPLLGRLFVPDEDNAGSERVIVLSHGLWQRSFGGDPGIVGKQIKLDSNSYTVIGVLPPEFRLAHEYLRNRQFWTSLSFYSFAYNQRGNHSFLAFGRLKPGVALNAAQSEMRAIASRLAEAHPESNKGRSVAVIPLHREIVSSIRPVLWVLFGAVGFTLLIVCANIANLLLAKATVREKEMAVRSALGANLPRLIRQVLSESLLLAALGGALGLLLACWGIHLLRAAVGAHIPRSEDIALNETVLGFTFLVSVATGLLFGMAPVLPLLRRNGAALLQKGAGRSTGPRHRFFHDGLVIAEIALTLMLVTGAGLLGRSFILLLRTDLGIQPRHILTFNLALPYSKYSEREKRQFFWRDAVEKIKELPGVQSVGVASLLPYGGVQAVGFTLLDSHTDVPEHLRSARTVAVSSGYFRTLGIPLIKGEMFDDQDFSGAEGKVVINEAMAKHFWPNQDPIGRHLRIGMKYAGSEPDSHEIVGIVHNAKQHRVETEAVPEIFVPTAQLTHYEMGFAVKTPLEPKSLIGAIRKTIAEMDRELPIFEVQTMEERIADTLFQQRFSLFLVGGFSLLALFLAALGIYGVMAYTVSARQQEIGIRMALGAQTSDVLGMVLKKGSLLAGIGGALGICGALAAGRLLTSLLYGIKSTDPVVLSAGPVVLIAVAMLACYLPARRAARVNPMEALRCE